MEITITGANALTTPSLHVWDWRVSLYLFLGGLSAGLAVMSAILHLRKGGALAEGEPVSYRAPLWVPCILAVGMIFIFWDLERKLNVFWLYLTVQPLSPMSWGSWGLLAFFPLSAGYALAALPPDKYGILRLEFLKTLASRLQPYLKQIAVANFAMGIFIGIYTGVLLSSFVARPLWNSAILPVLFLASALSAGAAFIIIIAERKAVKLFFTKLDIIIIVAEMIILPLLFYGQYTSSGAHRASIMPFFTFSHEYLWYAASIVLIGVVFPLALVLKMLEVNEVHGDELTVAAIRKMNLSAGLVLLGGLVIRMTFVYAGQLSKLS